MAKNVQSMAGTSVDGLVLVRRVVFHWPSDLAFETKATHDDRLYRDRDEQLQRHFDVSDLTLKLQLDNTSGDVYVQRRS